MSKRIYMECSVMSREVDARILMAMVAASQGYIAYVGRNTCIRQLAYSDSDQIYFGTNFSVPSLKRYQKLKKNKHKLFALDEEATFETFEGYHSMRTSKEVIGLMDGVFLNGKWHKEEISQWLKSPSLENKCHHTSNPRFEICLEKYKHLYKLRENIEKEYGDFVLVTTNGSIEAQKNINEIVCKLYERKELTDQVVPAFIDDINYRAQNQRSMILMLLEIVKNKNYKKIVFRIKPGEERYILNEFPELMESMIVCNSGNIFEWIHASKGVIGNYCTTLIEASFAGKPAINYVSDSEHKLCKGFLKNAVLSTDSQRVVEEFLSDKLKLNYLNRIPDELGLSATLNIMKIINENKSELLRRSFGSSFKQVLFYLKSIAQLALFCRNTHKRGGMLDIERVKTIVENINSMEIIDKEVKFAKVGREVLVFW